MTVWYYQRTVLGNQSMGTDTERGSRDETATVTLTC
jgi:hypothetical protein